MNITKEEIRNSITLDLEKAWENPKEARYWLEKLPQDQDQDEESCYDYFVEEVIAKMVHDINHQNKEYFEFDIDDLVDHYYINQKHYKFD